MGKLIVQGIMMGRNNARDAILCDYRHFSARINMGNGNLIAACVKKRATATDITNNKNMYFFIQNRIHRLPPSFPPPF